MINTRKEQSTSTPTGYKLTYCGVDVCMMSDKENLRENDVMEETGTQSCLNEKSDLDYYDLLKTKENDIDYDDLLKTKENDLDNDDLLKTISSTCTTFSMDSSESSENMSVKSLSTIEKMDADTDSISTSDFEGTSDFENYGKYDQCKFSVSELASQRLYFMAAEKKKRMLLLVEKFSESSDTCHCTISNPVDNTRGVRKNGLEAMGAVKYTYNADPSGNCVKKGRCPNTVRRSSVVQMKDDKINNDHNKGVGQAKGSTSKIVGHRLYLEGIERTKRLAILKKEYYKPKSPLETAFERRRIDTNGSDCDSNVIENLQQLYDLSKPSQEDGKKRRKDIERASAKRNEVWVHPSEKISIADSNRLYYKGMSQLVLARRRIEASEADEYRPRFLQSS